jgi:hypothetical protein
MIPIRYLHTYASTLNPPQKNELTHLPKVSPPYSRGSDKRSNVEGVRGGYEFTLRFTTKHTQTNSNSTPPALHLIQWSDWQSGVKGIKGVKGTKHVAYSSPSPFLSTFFVTPYHPHLQYAWISTRCYPNHPSRIRSGLHRIRL